MSVSRNAMSREDRDALLLINRVSKAIVATVNETPNGAPAGRLYNALADIMSLDEFYSLMRLLVHAGRVNLVGDRYFPARPH
jgi:hypothetical protein